MKRIFGFTILLACVLFMPACSSDEKSQLAQLRACIEGTAELPHLASDRADRFQGKVGAALLACRGGQMAVDAGRFPWVDWSNYYGTADAKTKGNALQQFNGVSAALLDLEFQRIELLKFNLFENSGTYRDYVLGRAGQAGPAIDTWDVMRLPKDNPNYKDIVEVAGEHPHQRCTGELIRKRTLTGICNDITNPLMGSSGQLFARNVEFEAAFPELGLDKYTAARHGDRIGLLKPDPQIVSRRLFTREGNNSPACRNGFGAEGGSGSECAYQAAPFFNVLAAFWIQFMTHDWFSHMEEGHNAPEYMSVGCVQPGDAERYGCRPGDRIDRGFVAEGTAPGTFTDAKGDTRLERAARTMRNSNTAWWDASQIYGYDETSLKRVKRDLKDTAMLRVEDTGHGPLLPLFQPGDPILPDWAGQESTAFPDNWTIGISFLTNLFVREHNSFVKEFRAQAAHTPAADCGLRNPAQPDKKILYRDVTPDELFDAARLVVSAEIAKIHTIEWTPQLLYDEPLFKAMNANWAGLVGEGHPLATKFLQDIVQKFGQSSDPKSVVQWYSVFASGAGIVGTGSRKSHWRIDDEESVNGGVNHFGSPFNFPEEFISVYRLHPLVPDLLEFRHVSQPDQIAAKVPVIETFRGKATAAMRSSGLDDWALTLGRQRLGALTLRNHPSFLQNLTMDRLQSPTKQIDIAALDLIRDREHGVPRFNEFRRQYGLRTLTSFDDFLIADPAADPAARQQQASIVQAMREIYGQHACDESKEITNAQRGADKKYINDCLGHPNGSTVDNIEDVDTIVGFLAEPKRPHGYAISETQFVVFIINASRRLFSDRFLTSSYRPEFYTRLGLDWVNNNGPGKAQYEPGEVNGHAKQPVSPLKRLLLRNIPELAAELKDVRNAFDPWKRDRGEYYSLEWKMRNP